MDFRLNAWLEDTFTSQLLLGNHWLHEKYEKKKSGVKSELDREWKSIYHDNGSCLDIINNIHPERNSTLQVVQGKPLTLTDGTHQVVAHLTPECARDLTERYPTLSHLAAHTSIAIRKYTIRYTSYGPPRGKLRFILHHVDWLGVDREPAHNPDSDPVRRVHWSEQVGAVLKQLHQTRAQVDRRCLRSDTEAGAGEEAMVQAMDQSQDAPQSQMPYTQAAFETQLQRSRPILPHTNDDELQITEVTSTLEPIMLGNTIYEEIRPGTAKTDYEQRMGLLNLLDRMKNTSKQSTTSVQGPAQSAFGRQQNVTRPATATSPKSPSMPQQPTQSRAEDSAVPTSPAPSDSSDSRKRAKEVRPVSPKTTAPAKENSATEPDTEKAHLKETTAPALECSWMKGMVFNSEALKVSQLQQECLARDTSWLKPQPGVKSFLDGNMPQLILTELNRIADERAAMEETGETDESDIDPSPDSVPEDVDPSPGSLPQATQESGHSPVRVRVAERQIAANGYPSTLEDEPPTSQVSWSPTPEPPQQPVRPRQGLPPDSSLENQAKNAEHTAGTRSRPSGPQSKRSPVIDISDDDKPILPPSSPPVMEAPGDSDEETDMEEYVPQALGEDTAQQVQIRGESDGRPGPKLPCAQSVVQARETPYGKGKSGQGIMAVAAPYTSTNKQAQDSSGNSKHTSSTSIVYSTYDMPSATGSADGQRNHTITVNGRISKEEKAKAHDNHQEDEADEDGVEQVDYLGASDVVMVDEQLHTNEVPKPAEKESRSTAKPLTAENVVDKIDKVAPSFVLDIIPMPAPSLPRNANSLEASSHMPHPLSGSVKRKPTGSPTKSNRRLSKKRQIKIVDLGDDKPSVVDPAVKLRKEREESLRQYREARTSNTSFKRGVELASTHDADSMDVDGPANEVSSHPMSPRHQSLYDDPSPNNAPPATIPASQHSTRHVPPETGTSDSQVFQKQAALPKLRSYLDSHSKKVAQVSDARVSGSSPTIFQSFKAAYPAYTGDFKHFHTQCKQILKLDDEDKMVPKWQWDDFIIRNRTDYMKYALKCIEMGEDAQPYFRFYKDNIQDTLYRHGVVSSRETVQKALEELDGRQSAPEPQSNPAMETKERQSPVRALRAANSPVVQKQPSRKSFPETCNQQKKPAQTRVNGEAPNRPRPSLPGVFNQNKISTQPALTGSPFKKPRHSLPARPPAESDPKPRPSGIFRPKPTSKPIPTSISRVQLDGNAEHASETAGDRFRDFYFAMQRTKSWTGSSQIDENQTWPQNLAVRPSIADAPRPKVDILNWGDVLGNTGWRGIGG